MPPPHVPADSPAVPPATTPAVLRARRRMLAGAALALALAGCRRAAAPRLQPLPAGAVVLALGDSLTHGTGADAASAYPAVLAQLTGWQVVNAGVPGDTAARGVARLPELLREHQPALVLVGLGGNDLLRRMPEADTRRHLARACTLSREAGAQPLLIAVPRPTLAAAWVGSLEDHPMYAEIAAEMALPLHAGGWSAVLAEPALRADAIHANAQGYARFAQGLAQTLRGSGLLV